MFAVIKVAGEVLVGYAVRICPPGQESTPDNPCQKQPKQPKQPEPPKRKRNAHA